MDTVILICCPAHFRDRVEINEIANFCLDFRVVPVGHKLIPIPAIPSSIQLAEAFKIRSEHKDIDVIIPGNHAAMAHCPEKATISKGVFYSLIFTHFVKRMQYVFSNLYAFILR